MVYGKQISSENSNKRKIALEKMEIMEIEKGAEADNIL